MIFNEQIKNGNIKLCGSNRSSWRILQNENLVEGSVYRILIDLQQMMRFKEFTD